MKTNSKNLQPVWKLAVTVVALGACVGREVRTGIKSDGSRQVLSDKFILPFLGTGPFSFVEGFKSVETKRWFMYGILDSAARQMSRRGRTNEAVRHKNARCHPTPSNARYHPTPPS